MRTTVDVDPHLLQQLRDEAHREGVSLKTVLNRALRRGLGPGRSDAEPYECPTFEMGSPLQPIDRAMALIDALEDEEITRKLAQRE